MDRLEEIKRNVAAGKESAKKCIVGREGWDAIAEQYEWLITEVERLRSDNDLMRPVYDAARAWRNARVFGNPNNSDLIRTNADLRNAVAANPPKG